MRTNSCGIAVGGQRRLRDAIEAQVRQEYEQEFSKATEYWQQIAIERKIKEEVKARLKRVASPQSLWNSCLTAR